MLDFLLLSTTSLAFFIPIAICLVSTFAIFLTYKFSKD